QPATGILVGRAILNGNVNSAGLPTTVFFEYGLTTNYGKTTATMNLAPGNVSVPVSIPIVGLSPATTYHYRMVATNSFGAGNGIEQSFATATYATNYVVTTLGDS